MSIASPRISMSPMSTSTVVVALLVLISSAAVVEAGGFKIPDQSTRPMGMLDAFIAGADDASSIYYNPAGIARLEGPQAIGNLYFAKSWSRYDGPGGSDWSDGRYYVVPNLYVATPVPRIPNLFAGIGVYSPFGLGSKWGDDSPVRYDTTLSEIRLINVNPTIAWKINDRAALGFGINYFNSRVILRRSNDYAPFPDGKTDFDADGDGWGYNLGLQVALTDTLRLGVTYRSQVNVEYTGDVHIKGVPVSVDPPVFETFRTDIESKIKFPQQVAVGLSWQATPKLRLELAAEWQNWKVRDRQDIQTDGIPGLLPPTITIPANWKNSMVVMLGAEYELSDKWTLRAGYGWNQTPVPDETVDPSIPNGDVHAVSAGAGYRFNDAVRVDLAGIFAYGEPRTIRNDFAPDDSDYDTYSAYLSFGLTYDF